jgi:hypothetical protein
VPAAGVVATQLGESFTPKVATLSGPVTLSDQPPSKPSATRWMVDPA